ncbi:MerR family transcriptional regulator [Actinomycetes bacterium M1A6_2h]
MKVSALAEASGVSVASIKYYVREGLLPAGTQGTYDEGHVHRLRLIRALVEVGGLPIARIRATLAAIDDDAAPLHHAFGAVMHGIDSVPDVEPDVTEVHDWVRGRGWSIEDGAPAPYRLAELLATLRRFGFDVSLENLDSIADSAYAAAELEVGYARAQPTRTAAVESMMIGTVVFERVYAEIRRLALEAVSARQ